MTMLLLLQRVLVPHGSYDINGDGKAEEMPLRACALAADAAEAWNHIKDDVVVSDMWRSADSSLAAVRSGRGAAAPGFSGHNWGISIDLDVSKTMRRLGTSSKELLDAYMADHGWHCWRDDHAPERWKPRPNEAWHYNFCSPDAAPMHYDGEHGNVAWLQKEIQRRHGQWWSRMTVFELQTALKEARMYNGALDGKVGPMTSSAARTFARAWGLPDPTWVNGTTSPRFRQTLAFVTAAVAVAPLPRTAP